MYTQLSQDEESDFNSPNLGDDKVFGTVRKRVYMGTPRRAYCFLIILGGAICAGLGYAAHMATLRISTSPTQLKCGNSSMEAQELGCVFDLLTNNWMPEYCSDPYTDAEYREWVFEADRRLGPWAFFHDENAEHRVTSERELSRLVGTRIYTTTENHLAHCAFLARRMHRLVTGEVAAVADNPFTHTLHCSSAVIDAIGSREQPAGDQIGSNFHVGIVECLV